VRRLRYTLPALADLESILDTIAARSPQGARRVQARIQGVIDLLAQHPFIGTRTNDPAHDHRALPLSHFLRGDRRRGHHPCGASCCPQPVRDARRILTRVATA